MIFLPILIGLILVGSWLLVKFDECDWQFIWGTILIIVGGVLLVVFLLIWVRNYYEIPKEIAVFRATQQSIENAKKNGIDFDDAALQVIVVKRNNWLARVQYYRKTTFWIFISSEVEELEPIR